MKRRVVILSALLLLLINTASGNFNPTDTSNKPWRIKESAFIEKYGENEKAKTFIIGWFSKRHVFTALSILSGAGTVGLAVSIREPSQNSRDAYAGLIVAGLIFGVAAGTLITIGFFIPVLTHSRKKLYRLLEKHKNGEQLPKRYRKQLEAVE